MPDILVDADDLRLALRGFADEGPNLEESEAYERLHAQLWEAEQGARPTAADAARLQRAAAGGCVPRRRLD